MADTIGLHRFDLHYDEFIVQQLDDGTVKLNTGFTITSPTAPTSTDTIGMHIFESAVGTDKIVQQLGDGTVKLNIL